MASLDDKIADLEARIDRYETDYETASTEDKKLLLLQTIKSARDNLTRLLVEKKLLSAKQKGGRSSLFALHCLIL
jgi:hypothetical protein